MELACRLPVGEGMVISMRKTLIIVTVVVGCLVLGGWCVRSSLVRTASATAVAYETALLHNDLGTAFLLLNNDDRLIYPDSREVFVRSADFWKENGLPDRQGAATQSAEVTVAKTALALPITRVDLHVTVPGEQPIDTWVCLVFEETHWSVHRGTLTEGSLRRSIEFMRQFILAEGDDTEVADS